MQKAKLAEEKEERELADAAAEDRVNPVTANMSSRELRLLEMNDNGLVKMLR
jgi:hypothetical protein